MDLAFVDALLPAPDQTWLPGDAFLAGNSALVVSRSDYLPGSKIEKEKGSEQCNQAEAPISRGAPKL